MYSRLSTLSRILVLQVGIIVSIILFAGVMLKIGGHGRHDAEVRTLQHPGYRPPALAAWTRDRGWLLFAIPVAFGAYAYRLRRRFDGDYESLDLTVAGLAIAGLLFCLGVAAGCQSVMSVDGMVRVKPVEKVGRAP